MAELKELTQENVPANIAWVLEDVMDAVQAQSDKSNLQIDDQHIKIIDSFQKESGYDVYKYLGINVSDDGQAPATPPVETPADTPPDPANPQTPPAQNNTPPPVFIAPNNGFTFESREDLVNNAGKFFDEIQAKHGVEPEKLPEWIGEKRNEIAELKPYKTKLENFQRDLDSLSPLTMEIMKADLANEDITEAWKRAGGNINLNRAVSSYSTEELVQMMDPVGYQNVLKNSVDAEGNLVPDLKKNGLELLKSNSVEKFNTMKQQRETRIQQVKNDELARARTFDEGKKVAMQNLLASPSLPGISDERYRSNVNRVEQSLTPQAIMAMFFDTNGKPKPEAAELLYFTQNGKAHLEEAKSYFSSLGESKALEQQVVQDKNGGTKLRQGANEPVNPELLAAQNALPTVRKSRF